MRISDWSSDVCSSDLATGGEQQGGRKQYCSGVHSCHHGTSLVGRVGRLDEGAAPKRRSFTARLEFESSPMRVSKSWQSESKNSVSGRPTEPASCIMAANGMDRT